MNDYIEREAALLSMTPIVKRASERNRNILSAVEQCVEAINRCPAADVVPVRHGRWIKARGSWCTPGGDPVWECSECGKGMHVYGIEHGTYGSDVADGQWVSCPNCGARMDKDGDEDV